jgi:hypothetical protein
MADDDRPERRDSGVIFTLLPEATRATRGLRWWCCRYLVVYAFADRLPGFLPRRRAS